VFWGAVQDITCAIVNHINIIISPKLAFIIRIVYGVIGNNFVRYQPILKKHQDSMANHF
jgi:hypothetical protein